MFSLNPNFQRLMIIFYSFLFVACWSCLKIFRVLFKLKTKIQVLSITYPSCVRICSHILRAYLAEISLMILQYIIWVEISSRLPRYYSTIFSFSHINKCNEPLCTHNSPGNFSSILLVSLLVILKLTGVAWDKMWEL